MRDPLGLGDRSEGEGEEGGESEGEGEGEGERGGGGRGGRGWRRNFQVAHADEVREEGGRVGGEEGCERAFILWGGRQRRREGRRKG